MARIAEVVREVSAATILYELRDPRVKQVTVTRAEVSADLQHATVYVSIMGSEREQNLGLHGLQSAAGFIQSRLADRMQTRFTPVIRFEIDQGVKNSLEIARILREEAARHPGGAEAPPEEADAEGPADG
jgi:ribosome-binding factor A